MRRTTEQRRRLGRKGQGSIEFLMAWSQTTPLMWAARAGQAPIVKHLVRLHSGTVHVESELGHGATFILEFPAGEDAD